MMLDHTFVNRFVAALEKVPATETFNGRSRLLRGLPSLGILKRSEYERRLDLQNVIEVLGSLGRVKSTGVRPLIVVAQNALDELGEWDNDQATALKEIIVELEHYYGGEILPALLPSSQSLPEPEALVFDGHDERLPTTFLDNAILAGRSVARLQVPRVFNGKDTEPDCFGTGWLIAPGLLIIGV